MKQPFLDLNAQYKSLKNEIDQAILNTLNKSIFVGGEEVDMFEKEFSEYLGVKHCIAVNSGTDALILGIRALNLPLDSEIIVPANTFIATALGVSENGLKPVFCDIDENDNGINLDDLKRKITSRTRAIILVHLYGQPDKIDEVKKIIKKSKRDIYLIEDACQAHGADYKGKKVGNFGIFSTFSFYPGKNLGAYGDGGAIVTNNKKLADKYYLLRQYGSRRKYYHESFGVNSRLDSLQAAVLRAKLKHLNRWNEKRSELAQKYNSLFGSIPEIVTPQLFPERESVFHVYALRSKKRDALRSYLERMGVQTLIHYPLPLHLQKAYRWLGYRKGELPKLERIAKELISLPLYPEMKKSSIIRVSKGIQSFFKN